MNDPKQAFDDFADQMLNSAINGINEAVASKQREVNYWRKKAESFSAKYEACLYCQSDKDFIPEPLACRSCHQKMTKLRCQGCYSYFLIQELKEKEGYYWCKPCQPTAGFTEEEANNA